jgi:hypothetical protein
MFISILYRRISILWIGFAFLNLLILLYLFMFNWIEIDNFWNSLRHLNAAYSPYLGAIFAFYFINKLPPVKSLKVFNKPALLIISLIALGWNLLLTACMLAPLLRLKTIEESVEVIGALNQYVSWFSAVMIAPFASPAWDKIVSKQ